MTDQKDIRSGLTGSKLRLKKDSLEKLGHKDGPRSVGELIEWLKLLDKDSMVWTYESVLVCGEDDQGYVFWTRE